MQITKDMTIEDVVEQFPETTQVFSRYGVGCLGCSAAQYDSIGEGAAVHGLDAEELVQELNACIAGRAQGGTHSERGGNVPHAPA